MSAFHMFKSVREYLTPVLMSSAFLDHGMLTPEEFVQAGDHLIRTCPTWKWESGEESRRRPYLPAGKQFLSTYGIPCYRRVNDLASANYVDKIIEGEGGEDNDSWLAPELMPKRDEDDFDVIDKDDLDSTNNIISKLDSTTINDNAKAVVTTEATTSKLADSEYLDMEDESLALDESASSNTVTGTSTIDNSVKRSRRYDVSMTYDNYYRTPRIWLFGYNENGSPLTPEEIFQDIMQDYAKKTVTVDPHPHLSRQHASIHPCKHGNAMLKIIEALKEIDKTPTVEQYLFVFLKFIQSVVPTIEYDYTIEVSAKSSDA